MNWLDKLERKFGRYAIHNLMYYIIVLYVAGLVLQLFVPEFYYQYLCLDVPAILRGQVWRVVTFIIQPPQTSYLFMVFALYLYYMLGKSLEQTWGAFRFNLYFFAGMLFHVIAAFAAYFITGFSFPLGTLVSEYVAFLRLCGDLPGYAVLSVLRHSDQGQMAGVAGRDLFPLHHCPGFPAGLRRRTTWILLPVQCHRSRGFHPELRDLLPGEQAQQGIFPEAGAAQAGIPEEGEGIPSGESLSRAGPDTAARCAEGRSWTIPIWNSGTVPNVTGITNTVRIICLPIHMLNRK